ncbi:hypothetical protein CRE_03397 [Caenorhabditis remanei]|uniref:Uncharacterized protein n=1 Tax=Caenorhabditis remanei TaxID=31234 RepID=E3NAK9_CAERE|nr:hypothetical protein CRE_03397 [Caenorhabditis remanei]
MSRADYDMLISGLRLVMGSMRHFEMQLKASSRIQDSLFELLNGKFKADLGAEISDLVAKRLKDSDLGTAKKEKDPRIARRRYSNYAKISKIMDRIRGDVANGDLSARGIRKRIKIFQSITYGDSSESSDSSEDSDGQDSDPDTPPSNSNGEKDDSDDEAGTGFQFAPAQSGAVAPSACNAY